MKKASHVANRILKFMRDSHGQAVTVETIEKALDIQGNDKKGLQKSLSLLLKTGEVVREKGGHYALAKTADLVYGKLDVLASGNGFVNSVFVPENELGTALPGDEVLVVLNPRTTDPGDRGPSGSVMRIIDRVRHDIVGTLKTTERFLYVVPIDPAYTHDFYVNDAAGAKVNDRVILRFTAWENRHVNPEGEIIEVIGPADDPSFDTLAVMKHYKLPEAFSASAVHEAETISRRVEIPGLREDLRETFVFTIDPLKARDFDDALSLEETDEGLRCLGVHIADVSHFIELGSELDHEGLNRGNSVYLPDKVIPMLPEQLSNGVCSLRPNEDRLAFSAFITFDESGEVLSTRFAKTLIHSKLRLTYEQAMATLDGREKDEAECMSDEARKKVFELDALAQQLRQKRYDQFALELDMVENEVRIGEDGMISEIVALVNDRSHQLIEECMVAANEAVAKFLSEKQIPVISRLHEPPSEEKLGELTAKLVEMGYTPGNLNHPRNLSHFLKSIAADPLATQIRIMVLRSLRRALYDAESCGHFGLAKAHYAHFTSPIRRYPDLTVHRQLQVAIGYEGATRKQAYDKSALVSIAKHCSETELTADEASRNLMEIKKYRYLEQQVQQQSPKVYDAVVMSVMRFGVFVELVDLQVQGLVHVSQLSSAHVRYHHPGELRAGKKTYRQGTALKVRPLSVDYEKRRIDFAPED